MSVLTTIMQIKYISNFYERLSKISNLEYITIPTCLRGFHNVQLINWCKTIKHKLYTSFSPCTRWEEIKNEQKLRLNIIVIKLLYKNHCLRFSINVATKQL